MDQEAITSALRELARQDEALEAPAQVEAVVLAAFRRRKARGRLWVGLAAAAALLIGISVALLWPGKPAPKQAEAVMQPASTGNAVEVGTDYIPLRAGPVLDAGELGHVIRVPASPAMLARFGYGMTQQAAGWDMAPVHADVLVGFDGTARAVRFVR